MSTIQVSEKRVHCALIRTIFAVGERVCQAADDTKMQVGSVGSVIKVHEGTGRYSVNFGEDANGRGGVQEVHAMDIRRLRPDDYKFVFAVAVRSNNEEEVLDLIKLKANPNATDEVCVSHCEYDNNTSSTVASPIVSRVQDPESDFYGLSPLSIAAYNGNQSMARLLLEHKANVNSQVGNLRLSLCGDMEADAIPFVLRIRTRLTGRLRSSSRPARATTRLSSCCASRIISTWKRTLLAKTTTTVSPRWAAAVAMERARC